MNVDPNCIRRLAVDRHNQIGLSDAPDVECERHVDLVEASELSLSIGIENRYTDPADGAGHVSQRRSMPDPAAVKG